MIKKFLTLSALALLSTQLMAQAKHEDTEYYTPVPPVVTTGAIFSAPPSDAVILLNGKSIDEWVTSKDTNVKAKWKLSGDMMTVDKPSGDIETKRKFSDYQLHIEYQIPANINGQDQARGNSGIFLGTFPGNAGGYELQVLDNYNNKTYVNGQAGSIYKQNPPLVNACKKPGEWQTYDVVWTAPKFNADGTVKSPARVTAFHNGVLVQNNFELKGDTPYVGQPQYKAHGPSSIRLQAHGDKSEPISYRNIWLRNL